MLSMVHQFYAMASDCAVHLCGETAEYLELFAAAAEAEVRRIEARYSRYRSDSELARINKVAATGGVIDIDAETAGLIAYAKACFAKSDGAFDITSGLLRTVWDFSASRLPDQSSIDAVLPFIGLDNVALVDSQLHFRKPGIELDFGGLGKDMQPIAPRKCALILARVTASSIWAAIFALSVSNPGASPGESASGIPATPKSLSPKSRCRTARSPPVGTMNASLKSMADVIAIFSIREPGGRPEDFLRLPLFQIAAWSPGACRRRRC